MSWRVLLVCEGLPDPQPAGLALHVLGLADELHRRGHQVDILGNALHPISQRPEQAGPGRFFAELRGHQRLWKQQQLGCFHAGRTAWATRALQARIRAHAAGYDVVHYHGHWPMVGAGLTGLPFVQTRHDASGDCMLKTRFRAGGQDESARCLSVDAADCAACATPHPGRWQSAISQHAVQHLRRGTARALQAHPVIFVSQHLRDAAARLGITAPRGTVIHHAVPRDELAAAAAASPARQPDDGVQVFGAATLLPYKGFGALLDVLARQPPAAGWQLTVAGDGPERAVLQTRHPDVRFTGWLPRTEVLRRMAAADAVVVPSIWDEPCGATVLEGLALGRVVYALRRGGPPELAAHAGNGAGRLRLYDHLDDLAVALRVHRSGAQHPAQALADFNGDLAYMADQVLAVYARYFHARGRP